MSNFKKKKLQKAIQEEKARRFRIRKKQVASVGMLALTLGGTVACLAQADVLNISPFSSPARSISLPDKGPVNYKFSGTGTVKWSNGHDASANFMEVNGATTFCLEPFVDVFNGAYATKAGQNEAVYKLWNEMTEYQRNLINNITYIGEVNNAEADKNINLATQFAMWLVEAGQNEVSGLFPKVSEVDTSKLKNVVGGHKITGLESTGADISEVVKYATTILKQAVASSKNPDFNPNPLTVIAGSSATATDKAGVIAGNAGGYGLPFDTIKPSEGLTAQRKGNTLEVQASAKAIGKDGTVKVYNNHNEDFSPSYIYGTINPDSTVGQTLFATTDPAKLDGELKVKTIGLGQIKFFKHDADTGTTEAQGAAHLENSEWGVFYENGSPVKWSDGNDGYPITVVTGDKVAGDNVEVRMSDVSKGWSIKNFDYPKGVYVQETKAPEGYELSTKKYPIQFDEKDKYDKNSKNYIEEATAKDRVGKFGVVWSKAQDVNGSLTGLNGAVFEAKPINGTKGEPVRVTSKAVTDPSTGITTNGVVDFKDLLTFGDHEFTEVETPDGLQPINPFTVTHTTNRDKDGNITSYTFVFKDTVTGQIISTNDVDVSHMTDNNIMFNLNLGTFTDKPEEKPTPTITTTAKDKADGDKTLGVGQAQVTDMAQMSNLPASKELNLKGKVVYKDSGKEVKDDKGKVITAEKKFTTDENGSATVQLDFPVINTVKDQNKDYTVTELVTDEEGNKVVEENNYKDNPSQTVKVDEADGYTEVQDKEVTPETTTVTDKFFYEGLVKGDTYTVKITQAYDHNLKKVIDVDGSLTFKAEDTSGTVDVPVKVDAKKYAGHKITFYEDAWHGEKPNEKETPIISHHNKDDEKETFTVKKPVTPKKETPKTPDSPKSILPSTGEEKAVWSIAGLGMLLLGLAVWQREKIKGLFNKKQK
ncbi:VaFE repeat-containing surface-anchored protein [Lactococcus formosensis subsp. bovis]|uniref:VaFE repeat-containing surface-anchored protein n=1 Tax=Lactococcus formosensis TaxID=1281486 RepID=UPI001BD1732E|nr:VaFE repeat-containing surface-anchored protein [Lactococcus formosensis]